MTPDQDSTYDASPSDSRFLSEETQALCLRGVVAVQIAIAFIWLLWNSEQIGVLGRMFAILWHDGLSFIINLGALYCAVSSTNHKRRFFYIAAALEVTSLGLHNASLFYASPSYSPMSVSRIPYVPFVATGALTGQLFLSSLAVRCLLWTRSLRLTKGKQSLAEVQPIQKQTRQFTLRQLCIIVLISSLCFGIISLCNYYLGADFTIGIAFNTVMFFALGAVTSLFNIIPFLGLLSLLSPQLTKHKGYWYALFTWTLSLSPFNGPFIFSLRQSVQPRFLTLTLLLAASFLSPNILLLVALVTLRLYGYQLHRIVTPPPTNFLEPLTTASP